MKKLEDIQTDLAAYRLERARLRRSLQTIEEHIERLEIQQDMMEDAVAIVSDQAEGRASRVGHSVVTSALANDFIKRA